MTRMRTALFAALIGGIAITASAAAGGAGAPATGSLKQGLTYGARTSQGGHLWLRLRPDRRGIASHEVEWMVPASRCTDHVPFYSVTSLGSEVGDPMPLVRGHFAKTDVYRGGGEDAVTQRYRIVGTVTPAAVIGRFTVMVSGIRPDGSRYNCTVGPVRFTAVN